MTRSAGEVIFVQPALPEYRVGFFETLYRELGARLKVYASPENQGVVTVANAQSWFRLIGENKKLTRGVYWQEQVLSVPVTSNDVIVINGEIRRISNLFLLAKCKLRGAKTIWWGQLFSPSQNQLNLKIRSFFMKRCDAIAFYTRKELKHFEINNEYSGISVGLNNGLDYSRIAPHVKEYDNCERNKDILFVGRLTEKARLDLLINAISISQNLTLSVIGDGPEFESLKALAKRLNVSSHITWHGALSTEERISKVANNCKVFCYPGNVGLSLIHAFAYGLPAVLHGDASSHMPEFAAFNKCKNGWIFDKGSAHSLSRILASLVVDADALLLASRAARKTAESEFNVEGMSDQMLSVINRLCDRQNVSAV